MKYDNQKLSDALFHACVADQNKIYQQVLERAHQEQGRTVQAGKARACRWLKIVAGPMAACLAFTILVNTNAAFASAVDNVPVLSAVARVVTFQQWETKNDSAQIHVEQPTVEGTGNAGLEARINTLIQNEIAALQAQEQETAAKYKEDWLAMGNQESDFVPIRYVVDYETYYASDSKLSFLIRERESITTDTENTYTTLHYYNLDLATGEDLTLEVLLGQDWKMEAAEAVDTQIRAGGDERKMAYYQEFCLDKNVPFEDTQKFYLNTDGKVTIVFDEGWIAPMEDGPQSFVIG